MMNELKSTDLGLDRSEALTINTSREKHEAPVPYIPPSELPPFLQDKTHLIDQGLVVPCSKNV